MHGLTVLNPAVLFCLTLLTPHGLEACLPSGTKLTDVVSAQIISSNASGSIVKKTTVSDKLAQLRARCAKGKLVDRRGRQIYFYKLTGCWGNPPADYIEILERQRTELRKLRKRYTVVEMSCNTSGLLIQ